MSGVVKPRAKKALVEFINGEVKKASASGDTDFVEELQGAKRLLLRGATKVRKENPYVRFMGQCMVGTKGETKAETMQRMRECSEKWKGLSEAEKKKYSTSQLVAVDYS